MASEVKRAKEPAQEVRSELRRRRARAQAFPSLGVIEPGWDILLELYLAHLERRVLSVSKLCYACASPPTTVLRYITAMTDAGHILSEDDPDDGRRRLLSLAGGALRTLERLLGH